MSLLTPAVFLSAAVANPAHYSAPFVGMWGLEGNRCAMSGTPRLSITRDALSIDGRRQRVVSVVPVEGNVIAVRVSANGSAKIKTELLTVGTTGSRLFREEGGRIIGVYYRCD